MTRILIVDDQDLVRDGLRAIFEDVPDIDVVGEAADGLEAVAAAAELTPDVVLMDLRMPRLDGIKATRRIVAACDARVVVLSTFADDDMVLAAFRAGASGYLLKDSPREDIVEAVRSARAGEAPLSPEIAVRLIEHVRTEPVAAAVSTVPALTARELDVLRLLASGRSNAEIASELYVSITTVKSYAASLFTKLDVRDRVQAAVFAYERGIVIPCASPGRRV